MRRAETSKIVDSQTTIAGRLCGIDSANVFTEADSVICSPECDSIWVFFFMIRDLTKLTGF